GIVRAYLQRGMASRPQPVKLFTELTTFRYDKPQKGRFREFRQIDFEAIGESDPLTDAELVSVQWRLYAALGLRGLSLQVNTIGGGGRYDGLAEQLGGRPTPGVGFATGVERIILELKEQQVALPPNAGLSAFLVYQSEAGKQAAFRLAESLRSNDIPTDVSFG